MSELIICYGYSLTKMFTRDIIEFKGTLVRIRRHFRYRHVNDGPAIAERLTKTLSQE